VKTPQLAEQEKFFARKDKRKKEKRIGWGKNTGSPFPGVSSARGEPSRDKGGKDLGRGGGKRCPGHRISVTQGKERGQCITVKTRRRHQRGDACWRVR